MITFKSKIDGLLLTPLIIINTFITIFEIKKDKPAFILIIFIIVLYILFFAFIILTTKYNL